MRLMTLLCVLLMFAIVAPVQAQELPAAPTTIFYSSQGQRFAVSIANSSITAVGTAPPIGAVALPDGSWVFLERETVAYEEYGHHFTLFQASSDLSQRWPLLESDAVAAAFPYLNDTVPQLSFSADGTQVFFPGCINTPTYFTCEALSFDRSTGVLVELPFTGDTLSVAPDGQRALSSYFGQPPGGGGREYTTRFHQGTERRELDKSFLGGVVWLPDGRVIYTIGRFEAVGTEVRLAGPDGTTQAVLAQEFDDSFFHNVMLSPDGWHIAVATTRNNNDEQWLELAYKHLDQGGLTVITTVPADATDFVWR